MLDRFWFYYNCLSISKWIVKWIKSYHTFKWQFQMSLALKKHLKAKLSWRFVVILLDWTIKHNSFSYLSNESDSLWKHLRWNWRRNVRFESVEYSKFSPRLRAANCFAIEISINSTVRFILVVNQIELEGRPIISIDFIVLSNEIVTIHNKPKWWRFHYIKSECLALVRKSKEPINATLSSDQDESAFY